MPVAPKILIVTTCRWFSAARLAMAFAARGCIVEVVCPSDHPLLSVQTIKRKYAYSGLVPLRSLRVGILSSKPDLIVPCDDLAVRHLHRLYARSRQIGDDSSNFLRQCLEYSLGDPASYPITESRDQFMAMVHTLDIRTPETKSIHSAEEIMEWIATFGLPAVLKAEGTSGGEGVRIVHTLEDAIRAYRILRAPLGSLVAAKRICIDRDWNCVAPWLARRKRDVSIQSYVSGPDANMSLACWQGEIVACISAEVLETWKPKGPATLIRLIENSEMKQAAEKILRKLKFSGFCGLDFMMEKATGGAFLIEMNARLTQTSTLPLGDGRDLVSSVLSRMRGTLYPVPCIELQSDIIALFPLAWQGDTSSQAFQHAYHDIPLDEPELVQFGMKQIGRTSLEKWVRLFSKLGLHQS